MTRINDIKDDELRELAYKRTLEKHGSDFLEFAKDKNLGIDSCFCFYSTDEGSDFWWGVLSGNRTKIMQK